MVFQFSGTPRTGSKSAIDTIFDYPAIAGKLYSEYMLNAAGNNPSIMNPLREKMFVELLNHPDPANYQNTGLLSIVDMLYTLPQVRGGFEFNLYTYGELSPEEFTDKAWRLFSEYYDWLISQIPVDLQKVAKSKFKSAAMGTYEMRQKQQSPNKAIDIKEPMKAAYTAYMERVGYPVTATDKRTSENQRIKNAEIMQLNIQDLPVTRPETHEMFIEDKPFLVDENERLQNLVKHYQDVSSIAALPRTYIAAEEKRQQGIDLQNAIKKYAIPALAGIVVIRLFSRRGEK